MRRFSLFLILSQVTLSIGFGQVGLKELENGKEHYANDRMDLAVQAFSFYIDSHPEDHRGYYGRALALKYLKKPLDAIEDLEMTVKLHNRHLEARYALAVLYYHQKDFEKCIEHLEYIRNRNKNYHTETVFYESRNFDNGITNLRTIGSIDVPLLSYLGLSYAQIGRLDKSLNAFNNALKRSPNNPELLVNQAVVKLNNHDSIGAIHDLKRALAINSEQPFGKYNLHLAEGKKGIPLLLLEENNPHAFANKAFEQFESGELRKALENYSVAIAIDSLNSDYYSNRGLVKMKMRQYRSAANDFYQAIKIDRSKTENLLYGGNAMFKIKRYKQASTLYEGYLDSIDKDLPEATKAYYNKGLADYYRGNTQVGCQSLYIAYDRDYFASIKAYNTYCLAQD